MNGFSVNVKLGVWLDDLRQGVKQGLKTIAPLAAECVGLNAFSPELSPRTLTQTARRDLVTYIRTRGTTLAALRADVGGRRLTDARALDVNLSRLREAMQLAVDLGAAHVVVPAGFIPPADSKTDSSTRETLAEAARTLANLASTTGARICWQAGSEASEVLAAFLNQIDSGGMLEVDLNPGAFLMRGVDPLKALEPLSKRVALATAVDHYRGGAEAPFGQGDVRWGEVLIGLSTLQRSQPLPMLAGCSLEGDRVAILAGAYKRLLALRKNPMG